MRIATLLAVAALAASGCASDSTTSEPQSTTPTPDAVTTVDSTTAPTDELTSEIEFEWPLAGCSEGNLASSRLHRIDAAAGVVEWSVDTPWAPDGPVVLDHGTVVLVEKAYDRPSVVAYDLVTGEGQWQRRFDGLQAELVATDNRGVVGQSPGSACSTGVPWLSAPTERWLILRSRSAGWRTTIRAPPGGNPGT